MRMMQFKSSALIEFWCSSFFAILVQDEFNSFFDAATQFNHSLQKKKKLNLTIVRTGPGLPSTATLITTFLASPLLP